MQVRRASQRTCAGRRTEGSSQQDAFGMSWPKPRVLAEDRIELPNQILA
jgi:hypothetical protein